MPVQFLAYGGEDLRRVVSQVEHAESSAPIFKHSSVVGLKRASLGPHESQIAAGELQEFSQRRVDVLGIGFKIVAHVFQAFGNRCAKRKRDSARQ